MDSPTRALCEYIVSSKFEDIPEDVLEGAKNCILDSIGCVIGAATLQPGRIVVDLFTQLGGYPESSILATGKKLPCMHAAYVNSYLANLLDFDDTTSAPPAHPGATIVPPSLAVAEKRGASGKELITAVVTAYEAQARVGQAIDPSLERKDKAWGFGTHQVFGAATVSSKLLNFNVDQTASTLGLAGVSAPVPSSLKWGLELEERPISWAKNNYGWVSMGGILAAFLVEKGFVGNKYILDGERGFWAMASSDRCDFKRITSNLGTEFLISKTGFKPYGCCRLTHSSLDGVARIVRHYGLDTRSIRSIKVKSHHKVVEWCSIADPTSNLDAQFSIPHLIALELLGKSARKGLSDNDLADPEVRALASKVSLELSEQIEEGVRQKGLLWAAIVSVELTDGRVLSERVDIPKWDPETRPTREELWTKFMALVSPAIGIETSEALIQDLEHLEDLKDVSIIISKIRQGIERTGLRRGEQ